MRGWIVAALACGLCGCGSHDDKKVAPTPAALNPSPPPLPEAPPPPAPATPPPLAATQNPDVPYPTVPSPDAVGYPKDGWSKLKLDDKVPLCVFASDLDRDKAPFLKQVPKKPSLKAGEPVTFGVYGPGCVQETCDQLPSLQCWVDREGNTLKVSSRYSAYHKDGSHCSEGCREIHAGCPSPPLEAGKYTVQYGEKSWALRVPGAPRSACLP